MAKFISLTEVLGNDAVRPLFINVDHIQHIQIAAKEKDTLVRVRDKSFFVQESFEQVKKLILDDPEPRQPIVYSAAEITRINPHTVAIIAHDGLNGAAQ